MFKAFSAVLDIQHRRAINIVIILKRFCCVESRLSEDGGEDLVFRDRSALQWPYWETVGFLMRSGSPFASPETNSATPPPDQAYLTQLEFFILSFLLQRP